MSRRDILLKQQKQRKYETNPYTKIFYRQLYNFLSLKKFSKIKGTSIDKRSQSSHKEKREKYVLKAVWKS